MLTIGQIQEAWKKKAKKDRGRLGKELAATLGVEQQTIQAKIAERIMTSDYELKLFAKALKIK